jgi:hypothetical protein
MYACRNSDIQAAGGGDQQHHQAASEQQAQCTSQKSLHALCMHMGHGTEHASGLRNAADRPTTVHVQLLTVHAVLFQQQMMPECDAHHVLPLMVDVTRPATAVATAEARGAAAMQMHTGQ